MAQNFQFIDGTKHDRATRRLARSHVMKGKNVGRRLNRRSRKETCSLKQHEAPRRTPGQDSNTSLDNERMRNPPIIDTLHFVSFPVDALPESQFVINQCMVYLVSEACLVAFVVRLTLQCGSLQCRHKRPLFTSSLRFARASPTTLAARTLSGQNM